QVDILHPRQVAAGALKEYQHLVIPHNSLYDLSDPAELEAAVKEFVIRGGSVFHGPHCQLTARAFGIEEEPIDFDCLHWQEDIIPHGWDTVAFRGAGEVLAQYIQSAKPGILETKVGAGSVYSFGFQYGYAYSRRTMPMVPPSYGRKEMHPIVLLKKTPLGALIGAVPSAPVAVQNGVEVARFGDRIIIINHRSTPIRINSTKHRQILSMLDESADRISPHSAVYLEQ
ncbi:MAG: hypothetical protein JO353_13245, partial [Phycisphaerae bacterium]|nr:hypothetical protein [Phycisphaerae bacterium]